MGENKVITESKNVPWLKRHIEALTASELVKLFKEVNIPTPDELISYVGERYRRLRPPKHPSRVRRRILYEYKRLELVYNIVSSKLSAILRLPPLDRMDAFHKELIRLFVGDQYDDALHAVRRALRLAKEFWNDYRLLILSARDTDEARRFRREGSGRILSLVRRLRRHLELLRRVREEVVKTHIISEGLPVVVVAGIPSAGKSTLVKRVSTANPEVADYPFTTKTIIVGKARCPNTVFYIVDTPGLLERPLEELNDIERKALAALITLPDIVVFLFDASAERYVDVEGQLRLFDSIRELVSGRGIPVIPVVNKIDASDENALKLIKEKANPKHYISALTGEGLGELLKELCKILSSS